MSRGFKFFLIAFFISLPFWWGINVLEKNLEDFFFWQKISQNPQILTAQIGQLNIEESLKPWRNWEIEDLEIEAKSAISVLIDKKGGEKTLFKKAANEKLSIASLTKLMTANIILENYDLSQKVQISKEAVQQEGENGKLKIGEVLQIKDLLYLLLIESSNDAAYALAEIIGQKAFVDLMNLEAENLPTVHTQGLENTYFVNPTGLDPEKPTDPKNYSTAEDLVKLTKYLLQKPLIWEILATPEWELYSPDRVFHHKLTNTNELLGEISGIVGGKTGYTDQAKGCFLLVLKAPKNSGYLVNVILGSENRFEEMKNLINWLPKAYRW